MNFICDNCDLLGHRQSFLFNLFGICVNFFFLLGENIPWIRFLLNSKFFRNIVPKSSSFFDNPIHKPIDWFLNFWRNTLPFLISRLFLLFYLTVDLFRKPDPGIPYWLYNLIVFCIHLFFSLVTFLLSFLYRFFIFLWNNIWILFPFFLNWTNFLGNLPFRGWSIFFFRKRSWGLF